jgi:hypothetical protein
MLERYSYEVVADQGAVSGQSFRIRDEADDRVATCYTKGAADLVVRALNVLDSANDALTFQEWWPTQPASRLPLHTAVQRERYQETWELSRRAFSSGRLTTKTESE